MLALLPEDPDAVRGAIQAALTARASASTSRVVVTDTFGRAWRTGPRERRDRRAGLPSVVDLRGSRGSRTAASSRRRSSRSPTRSRPASGLVMAKAARVPVAHRARGHVAERAGRRRPPRGPGPPARRGPVPRVAAAGAARAPHDPVVRARRPCRASRWRRPCAPRAPRRRPTTRGRGGSSCSSPSPRASVACTPHGGGVAGGSSRATARRTRSSTRRIARSDAVLGAAPVLIVPWLRFEGAHRIRTPSAPPPSGRCSCCRAARRSRTSCWRCTRRRWRRAGSPRRSSVRRRRATRSVWTRAGTRWERWPRGRMPEGGASRPRPPFDLADVLRSR